MARTSFARTAMTLSAFLIAGAGSAAAGTRESVQEILRARHPIAMTAADWRKLGDDVDRYLIEAADDSSMLYGARQRAMSGLAAIGGPRPKEFLRQVIERPRVAPELLSTAVQAYARGFAKSDPGDVRLVTVPLLAHTDWGVRQGAVRALGEVGTKEAFEALRALEKRERHPAVQQALRAALRESKSDKQ